MPGCASSPDGSVHVFTGKVELGQGIVTALTQIVADELDVSLGARHEISGDTAAPPTKVIPPAANRSSSGAPCALPRARRARCCLTSPAAGIGRHGATRRWRRHSPPTDARSLCRPREQRRPASRSRPPKASQNRPRTYRSSASRSALDLPAKVTGGAAYVQDMRLPGMLHGRSCGRRGHSARLDSSTKPIREGLAGVVSVVRDGNFLGVVAEREEQAMRREVGLRVRRRSADPHCPIRRDISSSTA